MTTAIDWSRIETAARLLVESRRSGTALSSIPEPFRPVNDEEALAIQDQVCALLGSPVAGWKVSLPQPRGLFLAPLLSSGIHTVLHKVPVREKTVRIEPEIAFILGRDLSPRVTPYPEEHVLDAVDSACLVLELLGSRYIDPRSVTFPEYLADNLNNLGLCLGPAIAVDYRSPLEALNIAVEWQASAGRIDCEGRHPNGHPLKPLLWLVNFLSSRGRILRAGDIVTTGSYAGVLEVPAEVPLQVRFGDLGKMEATFQTAAATGL